jgi:hypothetical protein
MKPTTLTLFLACSVLVLVSAVPVPEFSIPTGLAQLGEPGSTCNEEGIDCGMDMGPRTGYGGAYDGEVVEVNRIAGR